MFLIDTNVIGEARKGHKANGGVRAFFGARGAGDVYLSVPTIGEIRRVVENIRLRGDASHARQLERWLELVVNEYADRILQFDEDCAQVWGRLMSPDPQHPVDKQIAAIALIHQLTVVTRNVDRFRGTGVATTNPFD